MKTEPTRLKTAMVAALAAIAWSAVGTGCSDDGTTTPDSGGTDGSVHETGPIEDGAQGEEPVPSDGGGKKCGPGVKCPLGQVCNILSCAPGASGSCVKKPNMCPMVYKPVCGCDGKTYANDCLRLKAGVPFAYKGKCKPADAGPVPDGAAAKKCGPFPGGKCPSGQVCNILSCAPGASGSCVKKPKICPWLYKPVCGCDGKTYANDCLRLKAGVPLAHTGKC